jgi:hypothetical protein
MNPTPAFPPATPGLDFELIEAPAAPVIDQDHPGLAGNRYGFEGGSVVKEAGVYHMFTAEMAGDPFWAKMRIAHWSSPDARQWRRDGTLYETSGALTPGDNRFSLWTPMAIFNEDEQRWNLFYIALPARSGRKGRPAHERPDLARRLHRAGPRRHRRTLPRRRHHPAAGRRLATVGRSAGHRFLLRPGPQAASGMASTAATTTGRSDPGSSA